MSSDFIALSASLITFVIVLVIDAYTGWFSRLVNVALEKLMDLGERIQPKTQTGRTSLLIAGLLFIMALLVLVAAIFVVPNAHGN